MPFSCGLPCFGSKDKRHSSEEEKIVEKPVFVAVPVNASTTASSVPVQQRSDSTVEYSEKQPLPQQTSPALKRSDEEPLLDNTSPNEHPVESTPPTDPAMADQLKGAAGTLGNTVSSGAQQVSDGAQSAASTATNAASSGAEQVSGSGTKDWNAMSEDQKKQAFDALPAEKKQNLSYYEWIKQGYHNQYENWMPWVEDMYLKWFTKDNKASYATKGEFFIGSG
jgi:hypothetical protein